MKAPIHATLTRCPGCAIVGEDIIAPPYNFPPESYKIEDELVDNLHLQFAAINPVKEKDIQQFIEKYGFLKSATTANARESIESIRHEIKTMSAVLHLNEAFKKNDSKKMRAHLKVIYDLKDWFSADLDDCSNEEIKQKTFVELAKIITEHIEGTNTCLYIDPSSYEYALQWECPTLLTYLYTLLQFDLTNKKLIRHCNNKRCPDPWFIANDKRQDYCNREGFNCKNNEKARRYKDNVKKKKLIMNNSKTQ